MLLFLPRDACTIALGGDEIAQIIIDAGVDLIRTSSRAMLWLEPLLEVEDNGLRIGFGPIPSDQEAVLEVLQAIKDKNWQHSLCVGAVEDIPFLKAQTRLIFARSGITDPLSFTDYCQHGGITGLKQALITPDICGVIKDSGLRGRGGAGFPTGIKWATVAAAALPPSRSPRKYIVCNADEGDSGSFADRMVMEGDPFLLIEGMIIAGLAVGADYGYIYIRSEYPHAIATMQQAIEIARVNNILGSSILSSDKRFDLEVRVGAGAYICGEETALLESIEGKRGTVRAKPPLPAISGLFGCPTVINNVLTLAAVPVILASGADFYKNIGYGRSRGSVPIQIAGNAKYTGIFEVPFGINLRELVMEIGGGTASGRPVRAVQIGGPLGSYFPVAMLGDVAFDYEALTASGGLLGHASIVVFDDSVDLHAQARFAMEFCAIESCGKCTPCRIGSIRGVEILDNLAAIKNNTALQNKVKSEINLLQDLCEVMQAGSLCALGGFVPYPVMSALRYFPQDFGDNGNKQ